MALVVSVQSCSTNEDSFASKKETYNSNKFQVFTSVNNETVDYAKGFSLLYTKYRKLHPDFSSNLNRNSEDEKATVYFYLASQMFTTDDGSKVVIYPLVKADKVIGLVAGILNKEEDHVSYRVLSETTEHYHEILNIFSGRLAKKLQHSTMMRPADECGDDVGGCGTIEPVTITPPRNIKGNDGGAGDNDPDPYSWNGNPDGGCGAFGDCGGGNNSNEPPQTPPNPCEKLKKQTTNITFKNNITSLEGKTGDGYESGYRIGTSADGSLQNQILQNKPGTQQVDLKAFSNTVTIMHSHYDGLYPIFSPGDIIFFNQWVVWAQNWNSVSTNNPKIPLNNLTFTLVTSSGNYSFNFDGTSTTALPNYTQQDIDDLNDKYMRLLDEAKTVANVSGSVTFNMDKLEKQFLKFIDDKMNMTGLKLYKTTTNGNAQLNLVNGNRNEVPCPN